MYNQYNKRTIHENMMKFLSFLCTMFILQFSFGQDMQLAIGETEHVVHYSIHLTNINTGNQSIKAFTEILLTPKIDNLQQVVLELKDLEVDSVLSETSALLGFEQSAACQYFRYARFVRVLPWFPFSRKLGRVSF